MRIPTAIRVKVRGVDEHGNSFEQIASTINVSRSGARLNGVSLVRGIATVELRRGWFRKAKFRIVWAGAPGTPEAEQIGLRLMESDAGFWGIAFPASQIQPDFPPRAAAASVGAAASSTHSVAAPVIPGKWDAQRPANAPPSYSSVPSAPQFGRATQEGDVVDLTWQTPSTAGGSRTIRERVASVKICWSTPEGARQEESCPVARVLGDKSCIVPMRVALREGAEVTIVNTRTNGSRPGIVSLCGAQMPDGTYPVAMDIAAPDPTFWGSGSVH